MDPDDAADLLGAMNPAEAEMLLAEWIPANPTRCDDCSSTLPTRPAV
ncbi:transport transmembrane domain protein [Mycobacterium xenopi 4042]|uniref:Transport transmembrane domain protein n=1 Tax=Mycobacterium xenopi 4042 TaxID=1299334 RepID=X8DXJ4_MYCXE|nr:transport transmembrane domain protein [Mycobacterium xenopi 4042]